MKLNVLLFLAVALFLGGCGKPENPDVAQDDSEVAPPPRRPAAHTVRPNRDSITLGPGAAEKPVQPPDVQAPATPPPAEKVSAEVAQVMQAYTDARGKQQRLDAVGLMAQLAATDELRAQAIAAFSNMLQTETSQEVKTTILDVLSNQHTVESVDAVVTQLDAGVPLETRVEAIQALVRMDAARALPALEKLYTDRDPEIQTAARAAVQELNTPSPTAWFRSPAITTPVQTQPRPQRKQHGKTLPATETQPPAN